MSEIFDDFARDSTFLPALKPMEKRTSLLAKYLANTSAQPYIFGAFGDIFRGKTPDDNVATADKISARHDIGGDAKEIYKVSATLP